MKRSGPLKRTPFKKKHKKWPSNGKPSGIPASKKRKKFNNKELCAIYDVQVRYWRYNGLKGIMWHLTSEFVRRRDVKLFGRCISCETRINDWTAADAGHYVSVGNGGFGLLFDLTNVNLQCKKCNNPTWTPDASIPYALELDRRYGAGTAVGLWERRRAITKEWTALEYDHQIRALQGSLVLL